MQAAAERWGFSARRRRPRHRQPPGQPGRPHPGRRRRDPAQPPAAPGRSSTSATSPPSSWTSSTPSPTPSAASSGSCRWPCCRSTSACCCCPRRSATRPEFLNWLDRCHGRKLELVESKERKVPLTYRWVPDQFLGEQLGRDGARATRRRARRRPWSSASTATSAGASPRCSRGSTCCRRQNKAALNDGGGQARLAAGRRAEAQADAPPRRRRPPRRPACRSTAGSSRTCSSRSCWPSCVCTETLAAGINLPARSVVLTSLVKGPFGKEKLIDPSTAHQIFGRAGRPQFDDTGLRLRPGPRGRRPHPALEGEVRPDPGEHQGPGAAQGEEGAEEEEAGAEQRSGSTGARASSSSCKPPRRASSTARARCRGGCWRTC